MDMLLIHYAHPTATLDHLDVNLVSDWKNLSKGKLLVQPFNLDATTISKHPQLWSLLFATVVEITNSQDVSVCAPKTKANSPHTSFSFLIYNITEKQTQTLLKQRVWSSTAVSTLNPVCLDYLFSIKGLTTMDNEVVLDTVKEVWQDPASLTFLQQICQSIPENLQEQVTLTLQLFITSLHISRLDIKLRGGAIAPVFNVYANGALIDNDNAWSQLRSYFASCSYAPQAQDPGNTIIAPFNCSLCHTADHPRGLCPFPSMEGWNGPKRHIPIGASGGNGGGPGPGSDGQKKLQLN